MTSQRKLVTTVYLDGVAYGPASDVPDDVAELITNPKAWGDDPSTANRATSKPTKPTKAEMQAEIERRNADRDDDQKIVPASDKNDDLAAALKADDEAGDN